MSIRKRNDADGYRRGAIGIDGDKDHGFTWAHNQSPWDVMPAGGDERSYSRNKDGYTGGDKWVEKSPQDWLRNKEDFSYRTPTRSIANLVLDDAGEVNAGYSGALPNVDMDN